MHSPPPGEVVRRSNVPATMSSITPCGARPAVANTGDLPSPDDDQSLRRVDDAIPLEGPWYRGSDVDAFPESESDHPSVGTENGQFSQDFRWTMLGPPSGSRTFRISGSGGSMASSARSSAFSDSGTLSSLSATFTPPADMFAPLPRMPACHRCPINQEVMTDPVMTVDGITYERENIVAYFRSGRRTSPVTGKELPVLEIKPNTALREAIENYSHLHATVEQMQREWEAFLTHQGRKAALKLLHKQRQVRALKSALEQSDRKIHALEVRNGVGKPSPSVPSSASVSTADFTTSSTRTPSDNSPLTEPAFKAGAAPRTDRTPSRPSVRRKRTPCPGFFPS